jgi:hypothetical protein
MSHKSTHLPVLLVLALLLIACAGSVTAPSTTPEESSQYPARATAQGAQTPTAAEQTQSATKTKTSSPTATQRTPPPTATQAPEYRWSQLLGRDDITPIYNPEFVSADDAGYADGELVMGVEIDGQAKAYPVGLLNEREMVNDELAGIPILVTW